MNGGIWHELRRAFGSYQYGAANRLTRVDGVGYTFANNGNLLSTGLLTNTFDAANRLIETTRAGTTLQPSYDGLGNRVAQTVGLSTTSFVLDSAAGLPEVICTSAGNAYLHLPGVIMTENATGTVRYLLSDGLGSMRQAVDETGQVVGYQEFDPYGNPVADGGEPYGYTGEWWEEVVGLLYLRARWYRPETGSFVSVDPVAGEPPYLYVRGNPINYIDPSGRQCPGCPPEPGATATPGPQRPTPEPVPVPTPVVQGTPTPSSLPTPTKLDPLTLAQSVPSVLSSANGYVEGRVKVVSIVGCVWSISGEEIVYDFASRQRQRFQYTHAPWDKRGYAPVPGLAFSIWGGSEAAYGGFLWGFSGQGLTDDYKGYFVGTSLGVSASIFNALGFEVGPAVGWGQFSGAGDTPFGAITGKGGVSGDVAYFSLGASVDKGLFATGSRILKLPIDASLAGTWYEPDGPVVDYGVGQELQQMLEDVWHATDSPVKYVPLMLGTGLHDPDLRLMGATVGANTFVKNGWITPTE